MRLPSKRSNAFSGRPDAARSFMTPVTSAALALSNVAIKHVGAIDYLQETHASVS